MNYHCIINFARTAWNVSLKTHKPKRKLFTQCLDATINKWHGKCELQHISCTISSIYQKFDLLVQAASFHRSRELWYCFHTMFNVLWCTYWSEHLWRGASGSGVVDKSLNARTVDTYGSTQCWHIDTGTPWFIAHWSNCLWASINWFSSFVQTLWLEAAELLIHWREIKKVRMRNVKFR